MAKMVSCHHLVNCIRSSPKGLIYDASHANLRSEEIGIFLGCHHCLVMGASWRSNADHQVTEFSQHPMARSRKVIGRYAARSMLLAFLTLRYEFLVESRNLKWLLYFMLPDSFFLL
jgi:hypothetical protein